MVLCIEKFPKSSLEEEEEVFEVEEGRGRIKI